MSSARLSPDLGEGVFLHDPRITEMVKVRSCLKSWSDVCPTRVHIVSQSLYDHRLYKGYALQWNPSIPDNWDWNFKGLSS